MAICAFIAAPPSYLGREWGALGTYSKLAIVITAAMTWCHSTPYVVQRATLQVGGAARCVCRATRRAHLYFPSLQIAPLSSPPPSACDWPVPEKRVANLPACRRDHSTTPFLSHGHAGTHLRQNVVGSFPAFFPHWVDTLQMAAISHTISKLSL